MTEQELRALVREAIARHATGETAGTGPRPDAGGTASAFRLHPSHGLLALATGAEADGPCLIEPAVPCTHCGYCKSLGH